jgi:site-specific DNA recombinase
VRFLETTSTCRTVIAEKTDRLYRNLRDCLTLEDLNIEIHLPKEGQVISKEGQVPREANSRDTCSPSPKLH